MDGFQKRVYPEFGGKTGAEIKAIFDAFYNYSRPDLQEGAFPKGPLKQERYGSSQVNEETEPDFPGADFLVIAHRGWSGSYPENTLIAIQEAIHLGCQMIEFDVCLTRDRKLIVFHDTRLERTTDGSGIVQEHVYSDLRRLDAGSWFHPAYETEVIPSLNEVLALAQAAPGVVLNIELKPECWDRKQREDSIECQTIAAIKKYRLEKRVLISSYQWDIIERIYKMAPELKTALLYRQDMALLEPQFKASPLFAPNLSALEPNELKKNYACQALNLYCDELNQQFVDICHENELKVFLFTVNTYAQMEKYLHMSVDGFFTDHPNRLFRFIESHRARVQSLAMQERAQDKMDIEIALKRTAGKTKFQL